MQKLMNLTISVSDNVIREFGECYRHCRSITGYSDINNIKNYIDSHFPIEGYWDAITRLLNVLRYYGDPYNQDLDYMIFELTEIQKNI